jgi:hypothetical protein
MIWEYSDGTTVELGGSVTGDSYLAQFLREELASRPVVRIYPPPGGDVDLDTRDAAQLNAWLVQQLEWLTRVRKVTVELTSAPQGIPPLPVRAGEHVPGRVY